LHKEKRELRKSHLDHWEATKSRTGTGRPVDAIISPAVAYTAVPHGLNTFATLLFLSLAFRCLHLLRDSFYTTLCNAMDYSTSVFPVTFVDPELDQPHPPHDFHNHEDEAIYKFCKCVCSQFAPILTSLLDTPELFPGIPVGLQLIGRTQEEEAIIAMTEIVDQALKNMKANIMT
jgi:amidase